MRPTRHYTHAKANEQPTSDSGVTQFHPRLVIWLTSSDAGTGRLRLAAGDGDGEREANDHCGDPRGLLDEP